MWQVLFLAHSVWAQSANLSGDLTVSGTVTCEELTTNTLETLGSLDVGSNVSVQSLTATTITTQELDVQTITPPSGVLRIQGDVVISRTSASPASFLQVKDWREVAEDDFEDGENGWTKVGIGSCAGSEHFIGGHCLLSFQEIKKNYTLPVHSSVKVTASFHMFDAWTGESGYMKVDGNVVWSLMGFSYEKGLNVCGGPEPDPKLAAAVDVSFKHSGKHLLLSFGSTLAVEPCEASYAVDEILIYVQ